VEKWWAARVFTLRVLTHINVNKGLPMEISEIAEKLDRLRADLSATNTALAAISTVLTPQQRQQVLQALATSSAKRQEIYEQLPIAAEKNKRSVRLFQEAEARVHRLLQNAEHEFRTD